MFGDFAKKIKDKATQAAIKAQLKKMPAEQRKMMETLLEENPDLLMKMAKEAQELVKSGKSQMSAMLEVGKKYQNELREALLKSKSR